MNSPLQEEGCGDGAWPCRVAAELSLALTSAGESRRLECGERLFSLGDAAEGVYLIVKGRAQARLAGEAVCRTAGVGSMLGLPAALCAARYQFDVEALEAVEAVYLPVAMVNEILRLRPELCMQVMSMMCDELAALKQTGDFMRNCTKESCSLHEHCRKKSSLQ